MHVHLTCPPWMLCASSRSLVEEHHPCSFPANTQNTLIMSYSYTGLYYFIPTLCLFLTLLVGFSSHLPSFLLHLNFLPFIFGLSWPLPIHTQQSSRKPRWFSQHSFAKVKPPLARNFKSDLAYNSNEHTTWDKNCSQIPAISDTVTWGFCIWNLQKEKHTVIHLKVKTISYLVLFSLLCSHPYRFIFSWKRTKTCSLLQVNMLLHRIKASGNLYHKQYPSWVFFLALNLKFNLILQSIWVYLTPDLAKQNYLKESNNRGPLIILSEWCNVTTCSDLFMLSVWRPQSSCRLFCHIGDLTSK